MLDFLQTPLRPGIFNVADMLIYLGIFLIVVGIVAARQSVEDDQVVEVG